MDCNGDAVLYCGAFLKLQFKQSFLFVDGGWADVPNAGKWLPSSLNGWDHVSAQRQSCGYYRTVLDVYVDVIAAQGGGSASAAGWGAGVDRGDGVKSFHRNFTSYDTKVC